MTTATDDGVAMPSMGAGAGGVTGGGSLPDGGGVDAALPPPPQPATASNATQENATNNERMDETLQSLVSYGFAASGRKPSLLENRRVDAAP